MINVMLLSNTITGGYDDEEKAARAYDLAAMKYWGPTTHLNFPVSFFCGVDHTSTISYYYYIHQYNIFISIFRS